MTLASFAAPFSGWERAVALRYLMARRKEAGVGFAAVLAFLGVMLSIAAMIIILSVMNGFRTDILKTMLGFNGHLYVGGPILSSPDRDRAIARIRAVPDVTQAIPMVEAQAMVMGKGQIAGAIVRGVSPADIRKLDIVWNSIKQPGDREAYGQGEDGGELVFIGSRLAESLSVQPGDAITLISPSGAATAFGSAPRQKDYTVGGVFNVGNSQYDAAYIYMPLAQSQLFFGRDTAVDVIEVKVKDPDKARAMKPQVGRAAGPEGLVSDWTEKDQAFFNALNVERNVMRLILGVVVLISALLIVTGLMMLVKSKGRDVAILRTIGASRGSILRIFIMDGVAIGAAGTLAGVVISVTFCLNIVAIQKLVESITQTSVFNADVYFLSHIPARVDFVEVALIVAWSIGVSLIATLIPAYWGSRLDPVEALRYE